MDGSMGDMRGMSKSPYHSDSLREDTFGSPVLQGSEESARTGFCRSGRGVSLPRFVPMLMLSALVAGIMAIVLFIVFRFYYLFIFAPLAVGLPVIGMLYALIRAGRCRWRLLGVLSGLLLFGIYYGGFWQLNYKAFLVTYGAGAPVYLRERTGHDGFGGYVRFHLQSSAMRDVSVPTPKSEESGGDFAKAACLYGMETLIMIVLGISLPEKLCGRVFYREAEPRSKKMGPER